jgi:hypothetical protein
VKKLDHLTTTNIEGIRLPKITTRPKSKDNHSNYLTELSI